MLRRPRSAGLLLSGLLLALPMATLAQPTEASIEGIDWRLDQIAGSGVPFIDVPDEVDATLRVDGSRAGGNGGCNSWFGDAKVDGDAVIFSGIGSTMMACEEPMMSFEGQYLGYLDDVSRWAITDGRLELSDHAGAVLLVFSAAGLGSVAVEGTDWRVDTLTQDSVPVRIPDGIDVTLLMDAAQASGVAACNQYSGAYKLDGDALTFAPMAVTEMACEEPRMQIESAWLTALGLVTGSRVEGDRLILTDGQGAELATLLPAAAMSITGQWQLAELPTEDGAIVLVDSDAFVDFGQDGALTGDTGCNRLMSDYAVDGETIKISPVAITKMACKDPAIHEVESALLAALERAAGWRITVEGWLELVDASGTLLAGFTPGTVSAA